MFQTLSESSTKRCQRKNKRLSRYQNRDQIIDAVSIEKRLNLVAKSDRTGDFAVDTIIAVIESRHYFSKKMVFNSICDEAMKAVENRLNHRPRKRLKYKTLYEALPDRIGA